MSEWKPGMWARVFYVKDEDRARVTITGKPTRTGAVRVMNQRGERFTECVANLRKVDA